MISPTTLNYYIYLIGSCLIVLVTLFLGKALAEERNVKLLKMWRELDIEDLET